MTGGKMKAYTLSMLFVILAVGFLDFCLLAGSVVFDPPQLSLIWLYPLISLVFLLVSVRDARLDRERLERKRGLRPRAWDNPGRP
jgi:hypothetical protein